MKKIIKNKIAIFENKEIRRHWDDEKEEWYFSVVDIVEVLAGTDRPRKYWDDLKRKLKDEGSELSEKIGQLKMIASDGKYYLTDVLDTENILRLVQSIPSPKAEPFKLWLARVGYERLEETADPEIGIYRALKTYLKKGYSQGWINQRLKSIEIRKLLTDEWENRGAKKGIEFAILTDEITKAWTGLTTKEYKNLKGIKKENLRDNMTNLELVLNMLAETATTEIHRTENSKGVSKLKSDARVGGNIAGGARKKLEKRLGRSIVTKKNFLPVQAGKRLKKE
ncbi:MAG: antirepressor [Candidatus Zambryskibacteria bacterium RIFCSPHIGHO2_12_FULL_48_10]|uniref:Antirepressor n=1 Tax=Candidatus Zambryskibacteria bacterium RIFCSPHIGHO2_01_FULL_46_25 TaxID=1802738 RepID=A0A1G2T0E1_9BACT|nr:MAG: antirepressor [Candidatus Zambryskibacteria bacterium RIFCSPHIGHO2_01_FULL_46_25]OHB02272.1 MAG: antirepressor [Candidatus Zambryskibacteria bacterium RIFCSPHIGHO2_12_FULL_48_10]OHB07007.1 MAG: antirepressor [Candidatus Zambryskibacteria bacterium RIFCSPLOWO2_01_FULL_48_25]